MTVNKLIRDAYTKLQNQLARRGEEEYVTVTYCPETQTLEAQSGNYNPHPDHLAKKNPFAFTMQRPPTNELLTPEELEAGTSPTKAELGMREYQLLSRTPSWDEFISTVKQAATKQETTP